MMAKPHDFLIRHKSDEENARKLIAMGYPAVAPVLSHMMEWIQDMNWPVARTVAPFLASIGEPILDEVRKVFETDDLTWQYWCITEIIEKLPPQIAQQFRSELERLVHTPTSAEQREELDQVARDALERLEMTDADDA